MSEQSPVQKFAALAVARGDIQLAFAESGLRAALDGMFDRHRHEKGYFSTDPADEGLHFRLSNNVADVPAHWVNSLDSLYLSGRMMVGRGTVLSFNRQHDLGGTAGLLLHVKM